MAASTFKLVDRHAEWDRIKGQLRQLSGDHVTVGFHADAEPYEAGAGEPANVAQIASFHEFGDGVPQRSFFRPTMDGNREKYGALLARTMKLVLEGKLKVAKGLALVGLQAAVDLKQAITDLDSPPLAEATIARKLAKSGLRGKKAAAYAEGGANPLIDTGHMRQSVTYDVRVGGQSVDHPKSVSGGT